MRNSRWRPLSATVVLGLAAASVGCGSPDEPLLLTLQATSPSGDASVTYDVGDGPVTEVVTTPWELPVEVDGAFSISLRVENLDESGTVGCLIDHPASRSSGARGEVSATCELSGTVDGRQLRTSGSSIGEDREPDETGAEVESVEEEAVGVSMRVRWVAFDRRVEADPVALERAVIELVVGPISEPGQIRVVHELDTPERIFRGTNAFLFDLGDLDEDGHLTYRIPGTEGFMPVSGLHRLDVFADLRLDSGARRSFEDEIEYLVEPRTARTEEASFIGGAISAEVPTHWNVAFDDPLTIVDETAFVMNESPVNDKVYELLRLEHSFVRADLSVFELQSPLSFGSDEDLVDELIDIFGSAATDLTRSTQSIGGVPSLRITAALDADTPAARLIELDLLRVGDARLIVQAVAGREGDPWSEARALRDSLTFDASAVPRLLHRIDFRLTQVLDGIGTVETQVYVPANWIVLDADGGIFGAPDVDRSARLQMAALGGRSLDDVIGETGRALVDFDRPSPTGGFDDIAIASISSDDPDRAGGLLVFASFGGAVVRFDLFDGAPEPDLELFGAIVETLTVVDP